MQTGINVISRHTRAGWRRRSSGWSERCQNKAQFSGESDRLSQRGGGEFEGLQRMGNDARTNDDVQCISY
jgi:hypothetical protein